MLICWELVLNSRKNKFLKKEKQKSILLPLPHGGLNSGYMGLDLILTDAFATLANGAQM